MKTGAEGGGWGWGGDIQMINAAASAHAVTIRTHGTYNLGGSLLSDYDCGVKRI